MIALQSFDDLTLLLQYKEMIGNYPITVVEMSDVRAADLQTEVDFFHEILGEFCDSLENKDEIITNTFINIKNVMLHPCAVQKNAMIYSLNSEKIFQKMPQKTLASIL